MNPSPTVDIDKLARLARLELSDAEKAVFSQQIPRIVAFFDELAAVDVSGITPMAHPFEYEPSLRPDTPSTPWPSSVLEAISPAHRDAQVVVPKVIDEA